jgi:hypothetical protein
LSTDVILKLFGKYAIFNENIINNIRGRFNSSIENRILIIDNEYWSIYNAKHLNSDCFEVTHNRWKLCNRIQVHEN